jgi:hypothetical protein
MISKEWFTERMREMVENGAIEGDPSAFYPDEDSDESDNS